MKALEICEVGWAYLVCTDAAGIAYAVKRPPCLVNKHSRDGEVVRIPAGADTQARVSSNGSISQAEGIVPRYRLSDVIYAEQDQHGNWIDLNVDGRTWATES